MSQYVINLTAALLLGVLTVVAFLSAQVEVGFVLSLGVLALLSIAFVARASALSAADLARRG